MKRSHMVCDKCIYFDAGECHQQPLPEDLVDDGGFDTSQHWCGKGAWHQWDDRIKGWDKFYWGEWEDGPSNESNI